MALGTAPIRAVVRASFRAHASHTQQHGLEASASPAAQLSQLCLEPGGMTSMIEIKV